MDGRWIDVANTCVFRALITDPVASACLGTVWCASQVAYTIGYCRKDKTDGSGRRIGMWSYVAELGLMALSAVTGYQMAMG